MAKKSKSELAAEGKEIGAVLSAARQAPHNFALFVGKDDLIFKAHKSKTKSAMRQLAKADGATNKGAVGTLESKGKLVDLIVEDPDSTPANFAKSFKKFLAQRGHAMKVRLLSADGAVLDAGEDDPDEAGDVDAVDLGQDLEVEIKAVLAAFEKIKVPYVRALNSAPPGHLKKLRAGGKRFKEAIDKRQADIAKKILKALIQAVLATPSTVRIDDVLKAKDDPAKLAQQESLIDALVERRDDDSAFRKEAKDDMRALRDAFKDAINKDPAPPEIDQLKALKRKIDESFLEDLSTEGHGPQRHEGAVTKPQLRDRCVNGHDPMTGTTTDGAHGGTHKYSRHATRFLDPGDYVEAEEAIRASGDFPANKEAAENTGSDRFSVTMTLAAAMGAGYEAKLEGVSRIGSANNPTGSQDTVFTGGTIKAVYEIQADGEATLLTMYPNPAP